MALLSSILGIELFFFIENVSQLSFCSRAIMFDAKNSVYYCNRAAAYNKLGNFHAAVMDCKTAIQIDSSYSKAYGRMG